MKILFFSTGMGLGGAEVQICDLAAKLTAQDHEVHVAWMSGEAVVALPAGVIGHPFRINKTPWGVVKALWILYSLVQKIRPDIVHSHMVHANLIARFTKAATGFDTPLICTAHNSIEGGKLSVLAYRLTDRFADLTTNVSDHAVNAFIDQGASVPSRITAVHNGIDIERFAPDMFQRNTQRQILGLSDKFVILIVGRLEYQKNHESLLRAYAKTCAFNSEIHLCIVGYGSLEAQLKALVRDLGIAHQVSFLGARQDTPALFNAADCVVMSSRFEGFGLVLAEAMACGKFIIATDCGGITSTIKNVNQRVGVVVPIEDDEALEAALKTVIDMPHNVLLEAGLKAREFVIDRYSIDVITAQWLEIYESHRDSTKGSDVSQISRTSYKSENHPRHGSTSLDCAAKNEKN